MASETLEETNTYAVEWDDDLEVPVFTWKEFVFGETFREISREWEDVIARKDADKYIVNTKGITAHDEEDTQWLAETWIPDLIDRGVQCGAGIFADSAIASMDMEQIETELSAIDPDYEFRVFATEGEAKEWLAEQ